MFCSGRNPVLPVVLLLFLTAPGCDALVDERTFADAAWNRPGVDVSISPADVGPETDLAPEPEVACVPQCDDKECGDDGCGGVCGYCSPCDFDEPWGQVQRVIHLAIGNGGFPGEGLDVDGDAGTCQPVHACAEGIDNQLGGVFRLLRQYLDTDGELADAITEGALNVVFEWRGQDPKDGSFKIAAYTSEPDEPRESCDWQYQTCTYTLTSASFDLETCMPEVLINGAHLEGAKLTAGWPDDSFELTVPLSESATIGVTLYRVQLAGTVIEGEEGPFVLGGVLAGAVRKTELVAAIKALPDGSLPINEVSLLALLELFVESDIDTTGDGQPDAASIGLPFEARPARLSDPARPGGAFCSPDGVCL